MRGRPDCPGDARLPIINEQFSAGGVESVRGYLESERQGDNAVQLNLELRSPPRTMSMLTNVAELRAHGFIDAAWLNIREPLPGQARDYSLAGAGLGLRGGRSKGVGAAVDLAWALEDGSDTQKGDLRFDRGKQCRHQDVMRIEARLRRVRGR